MPILHVVTGDGIIFDYPFTGEKITLGRSKNNDLSLKDITVSRHHAEIRKDKQEYLIVDLGSYNGTKLNGRLIQTAPLHFGDKVQIGLTRLTFLEKKSAGPGVFDTLILTTDGDFETGEQRIVESSPRKTSGQSRELLVSMGKAPGWIQPGKEEKAGEQTSMSDLARINKVLFVLYEISRQLNQINDFDQLLKKIMDLIFIVIDADYGFLVLLGGQEGEELIPVVVKHREKIRKKGKELKASKTLIRKVIRDKVALLTSNAMADSRLDGGKSLYLQQIKSAMCVPLWRKDKVIGVIELGTTRLTSHFNQDDLELLKAIGSQMAMVIEQAALNEQIREEERMRNRLERFHSPQVIEMVLKGDQEAKDRIMDPKELTATVLFMDIVGFTNLSERMPPREVTILLNHFFSRMTDITFHYDGTLDKYIGDGLMAVFGAPMQKDDDAVRAIQAALDMRKERELMMTSAPDDKRFDIRIGINTGKVVAGNIGSPKRMDYTVIGDPVNVASRLESIGEPNQILIGEETYRLAKNRFRIRPVGPKKVKGKRDAVMVYEVID
ncbi:MAG TPA: FHA domain-containing protein [Desulfobacteraceae bacterium]|nr:FHA domain-containing protein [Desulfobacteraceae bacterium]